MSVSGQSVSMQLRAERFLATLRHCQVLGLSVEAVGDNSVTMRLPYRPQIIGNPLSETVHGGSLTTLMDTASGTAVFSVLPSFELCPTLDLRMDYMKAATPGLDLIAEARVTRVASSVVFTECEVVQENPDGEPELIAKCAATFMRIGANMTPPQFRQAIEQGGDVADALAKQFGSVDSQALAGDYQRLSEENFAQLLQQALMSDASQGQDNFKPLVDSIPYSQLIGLEFQRLGKDVLFHLPKNDNNIGNPILPAIHGGVLGGFMELAGSLHLMMNMDCAAIPKMIDFSLDYLRAGRHQDTYAECQVWRQGSRVANVAINAWQTERSSPIATARAHFLLNK